MYMLSTKEELYLYLEKISRGYALKDLKYFTANHISESLNISRNLASQYLNELVKEERAIKVNSRPVYFFHKKNVEREAQVALETCVFSGMDDFQWKCRSDENKRDFQKAIGYYLSLSSCIEQCKAAVKYPPNGLPALFNGAGGTGKAFLSRLMYEYAVNERVIGTAGAASLPPYITVDCSEYAQNEEKFAISLCGSEDGKGWLAKANGGILFFDEIDRLPFSGQELIYSYLISGQYKGYHDDEHVFESNARLIFSTTKVPAETLYKPLARMIPIVIPVPTLHERTADEKEEMLMGPLAGIGDTLFWTLLPTIMGSIAGYMALEGNPIGVILWLIVNLIFICIRTQLMWIGYREGTKLITKVGSKLARITDAASVLGLTVVGALSATVVTAKTPLAFQMGEVNLAVADLLDKIMPSMISVATVLVLYKLLGKKGMKITTLILIVIIFSMICSALGILA